MFTYDQARKIDKFFPNILGEEQQPKQPTSAREWEPCSCTLEMRDADGDYVRVIQHLQNGIQLCLDKSKLHKQNILDNRDLINNTIGELIHDLESRISELEKKLSGR